MTDLLTNVPAMPRAKRPWWTGRVFFCCPCGARDERKPHEEQPDTLPCWRDKCDGTMEQWTPPAVQRAQEEDEK